jgi:hypothetical protein
MIKEIKPQELRRHIRGYEKLVFKLSDLNLQYYIQFTVHSHNHLTTPTKPLNIGSVYTIFEL